MATTVSQLVAKITVEGASQAKSDLSGMKESADGASGGLKGMLSSALSFAGGQAIFNLAAQGVSFLKDQLTDCFKESMDAQQSMAQTQAVIKSTGDASGMSAQQIADMAGNLSHLTDFSDDTIQAGENMLLTFTNIGKTVFPQATKTLLDLSQAMGGDVKGAAIQMGKALNDPEKGITALTRVGVTFTQQQKDQIKAMQDVGNMAGAQTIILNELNKEFGGSAEAAGKTFGGQLIILKQRLSDVKQSIGDALLPILQQFTAWLNSTAMPALERFATWFTSTGLPAIQHFASSVASVVGPAFNNVTNFIAKFTGSANALTPVLQILGVVLASIIVPAMASLAISVIAATWPVLLIVAGIALLTATFLHFYNTNAQFKAFIDGMILGFQQAWTVISTNFIPVMQQIGNVIMTRVWPVLRDIGAFLVSIFTPTWKELVALWQTQLVPAFNEMAPYWPAIKIGLEGIAVIAGGILLVALGLLVGIIKGVVVAFAALVSGIAQAIGGVVQIVMGFVTFISGILALIYDLVTGNWSNLATDVAAIWYGIQNMVAGVCNVIMGIVGGFVMTVIGFFWGLVTGIIDFFRMLYDQLVGHSIVPELVNGILGLIRSLGPGIMAAIASIPGIFMNIWNTCIADATSAGANICNGIANGIRGAIAGIGSAIASVTQFISDHLPHSPAKIGPLMHLAEQGSSIVDQISIGLLAGMPKLNDAMTTLTKPVSMSLTPGTMSNGVNLATIGSSNNQQPIYIQNFIDGKQITNNVGPRIIKSGRTTGPLRAGL